MARLPLLAACVVAIVGATVKWNWLFFVWVALVLAFVVLDLLLVRCPYCGECLGYGRGAFCKNCGHEIDYNAKD
ncbi:MAG: hypothetical protein HFF09_02825 [Oscillospiraceae bacterium]|nr:hypothetical protein [Oscillospiraceae bacterium]